MKNTLIIILVVAFAIGIGVALSVQLNNNPMIGQQLGMVLEGQTRIEQRITSLDEQQKKMLEIFESARKAAEKYAQAGGGAAQQRQAPPPPDMNQVHEIPVASSPIRGNPDAAITLVQFTDIQCPFCQRFYPPMAEALKAYPNDVKIIVKNFPLGFHPNAKPAAKAAMAAGEQGKYWEMMDALLEPGQNLAADNFPQIAKKVGLNIEKFSQDLQANDAKYEDIIQKDLQLGAQVGVQGTPTFFLNGKLTNARDFNGFKAEIDRILSEKKK